MERHAEYMLHEGRENYCLSVGAWVPLMVVWNEYFLGVNAV